MAVLLTAEVSYSSLKEIRFQHDCILVQLCTGKDVLIRSILVFPTCLCTGTCSLKVVDYERLNSHLHLEIHLTKPKILRLRKHKLKKLQEKKYGRVIVFYYSALVVGCCATQQRRRKTHFCEVYSTPLWMFCEVRMLSRHFHILIKEHILQCVCNCALISLRTGHSTFFFAGLPFPYLLVMV
ncbi:hypothetical protein OUZ56_002466 [Daphnia magna]|nr:hypothetical protein OUZ56_002466 [Daphnia magna]